jgi:phage I-like protein
MDFKLTSEERKVAELLGVDEREAVTFKMQQFMRDNPQQPTDMTAEEVRICELTGTSHEDYRRFKTMQQPDGSYRLPER